MTDAADTKPNGGPAVVAERLEKSYPTPEGDLPILLGIDLVICAGEIVAVTGESGAGKSTLLHLLGGLDRPTGGRVLVKGVALDERSDDALARFRNRSIGFVFQFHHLLPDFTALENVMIPQLIAGRSRPEAAHKAKGILESVGLGGRMSHRPYELSGGEQQRVAVARALANDPTVVLADEPSGNLDFRHSRQLHDLIWELARANTATFVIATHDRELAGRADREIRLEDGLARELSHAGHASYLTVERTAGEAASDPPAAGQMSQPG